MADQSTAVDSRRAVLRAGAALAIAGPALLRGTQAGAQPQPKPASPMTIIDSQVHAYAANTPERPWFRVPNWPAHVTGDEMVAAMSKVGVDNMMWGSDYPHSESTFPQSRKILTEILEGVPDDEQAKIVGLNTARVYHFDLARLTVLNGCR